MNVDAPLIAPSSREHGIPDTDMVHAFNNPIFVDALDDGFTMFIGVVETSDGPIILHAMPARPKYLK